MREVGTLAELLLKSCFRCHNSNVGKIVFRGIFAAPVETERDGPASVEWERCIKHPDHVATEAAELIKRHIIQVQERAFDANMQAQGVDTERNRAALGLK